jgi:hypothetical protein
LDRLVRLKPPSISDAKRLPESVFWTRFEEMQPRVLGALFTAVSTALRRKPEVMQARLGLTGVRFTDFAHWVIAAAPALGFTGDEFIEAYKSNRAQRDQAALENSVIYPALMWQLERRVGNRIKDMTMSELFQSVTDAKRRLNAEASSNGAGYLDQQDNWPKISGTFSAALRRIAPSLRKIGVAVSSKTVRGTDLHNIDARKYFRDLRDGERSDKKRKKNLRKKSLKNLDKSDEAIESS